jgi:hypothetical protein
MGKMVIYTYVSRQCHTQFILPNSSRRYLINMYFYERKVSLIGGASVTIILCLHVLIVHHIFINLGYVDYFQSILYFSFILITRPFALQTYKRFIRWQNLISTCMVHTYQVIKSQYNIIYTVVNGLNIYID